MFLIIAAVVFGIYIVNVVLGATGGATFVGDVGEMLLLFAAAIAFVIAVLRREAAEKAERDKEN